MSAERLREAATRLREVAGAATPGPWGVGLWMVASEIEQTGRGTVTYRQKIAEPDPFDYEDNSDDPEWSAEADADYIATMHPPVALALADWLDDLTTKWPWDDDGTCVWDDGTPMRLEESPDTHALAVADAVLGGEER